MNIIIHDREVAIKKQFTGSMVSNGELERMQERIDTLENAVAHLMAFLADRLRLTLGEIDNEDGLLDF